MKNTNSAATRRNPKPDRASLERNRARDLARLNSMWRALTAPSVEHAIVLAGIVVHRVAS